MGHYTQAHVHGYLAHKKLTPPLCPLGSLGFEGALHRQTLRPSSRRDPQQSPASFRIAVKDLEDPAVPCTGLAVSVQRVILKWGI